MTQPTGRDETFVRIIQVAQEDSEIREQLLAILSLDPFNRKSALNEMLREFKMKNAPQELVKALSHFLDDEVADKALSVLRNEN